MSLPAEQLDRKTLDRLDLPKTFESQTGLDRLLLQKFLNLVYNVNDLWNLRHRVDIRDAAAVTAAGVAFTAPVDARRIVFAIFITYTATATVGTRTVEVTRENKAGNVITGFISQSRTASQAGFFLISEGSGNQGLTVVVTINFPVVLEPEWAITVDDSGNIDNNDSVAWSIDYVEIPI